MDLKDYLEALKVERNGYLRYGRKERAADVDKEIKRVEKALGKADEPETPVVEEEAPKETPAKRPPGRPRKEA